MVAPCRRHGTRRRTQVSPYAVWCYGCVGGCGISERCDFSQLQTLCRYRSVLSVSSLRDTHEQCVSPPPYCAVQVVSSRCADMMVWWLMGRPSSLHGTGQLIASLRYAPHAVSPHCALSPYCAPSPYCACRLVVSPHCAPPPHCACRLVVSPYCAPSPHCACRLVWCYLHCVRHASSRRCVSLP